MSPGDGVVSEDLLELLYLCPTALVKFDLTGTIALMNPMGIQLLMPIAKDGSVDNFFTLFATVAPELREMVLRFPERVGRICDEHRVLASTGTLATTRALVLSVTIQKVDADAVVAVIADVTAAAYREQLIRTNEARLRATFDGVRDYSICTVDPMGKVTSWNRSAERLDGYRADEIIGTSADVLVAMSGVTAKSFAAAYARAREKGFHEFEGWRIRKDGKRYWATIAVAVLREQSDAENIMGYSIVTRDITEERRSQDELQQLVVTDALTGALNRRGLFELALREEVRLKSTGGCMSLLMLDVDHFKELNDEYGHAAGDLVLKHVVMRAQTEMRTVDAIGRYGGEEFAILLPGSDQTGAMIVAERIRARIFNSPIEIGEASIQVSVSIGVAQTDANVQDIANLIKAADVAMYGAKREGRNRISAA